MAMSCFYVLSSPKAWYRLSWLCSTIFILTALFYTNIVSCSHPDIPNYHDRCDSIVPASTPTAPEFKTIPFPPEQDGYCLGGDELLNHQHSSWRSRRNSSSNDGRALLFRTHNVYSTDAYGVYKVVASLILQPSRIIHGFSDSSLTISTWSQHGALSFEIEGFWSKSSGKLCMVGSTSSYSDEGQHHGLSALLTLNDVRSWSNITSLVRGRLESLSSVDDSNYFQPISLLMFPLMNYTYTEVAKEADYGCIGGFDSAKGSISLPLSFPICSVFLQTANQFELKYSNDCNSSKNCKPLREDGGNLPQIMSLSSFQCSNDRQSLRFLVNFLPRSSYYRYDNPFNPNTTLVAEGSWNAQKNQLCVVACRLRTTNSLDSSQVEDCSMRLSLRFPSILSIRNTSSIVGYIWSNKTAFGNITFQSYTSNIIEIPGLKYEYTMIDRARNSCPKKQPNRSEGRQYPDANPYNMQLQMSVRNRNGRKFGWGYASVFAVGDKIAPINTVFVLENSKVEMKLQALNISYKMSLTSYNASSKDYKYISISAEGIYDGEAGVLCMAGCKYLESNSQISVNDSMDCDILVNIQFPPLNSKDHIKGRIESTREKSSSLYFESLSFSAVPFYSHRESIWRMDLEIIMALISNTLVCIFVGCQIWHVKKHANVFPFISLLMLAVLALGHMIPLVLNFEALFFSKQNSQFYLRSAGGWLEVNEVIVRVVTMVAFLLQVRLLQLVSSARLGYENQKAAWIAERKTLYVSLPLYIVGGLIALSVNWKNYKFGDRMSYSYVDNQEHSLWVDLKSYSGLVLDGFLLPQVLLNIFHNSRESALSPFFYMGTTFVRLLPHAYDLYRANFYVGDFDWSYMYADPSADYYSSTWDVIIPLAGLLLAAIIYLQQRSGGRFSFPKRYEKVPVACDT